jgi:hypothetical protein
MIFKTISYTEATKEVPNTTINLVVVVVVLLVLCWKKASRIRFGVSTLEELSIIWCHSWSFVLEAEY